MHWNEWNVHVIKFWTSREFWGEMGVDKSRERTHCLWNEIVFLYGLTIGWRITSCKKTHFQRELHRALCDFFPQYTYTSVSYIFFFQYCPILIVALQNENSRVTCNCCILCCSEKSVMESVVDFISDVVPQVSFHRN